MIGVMANDHYVPQFYLRAFTVSPMAGELYLYRRGMRPKRRRLGQACDLRFSVTRHRCIVE
jgi:hypothetical protein